MLRHSARDHTVASGGGRGINVELILDPNDVLYDAVDGTVFLNLGSHTHGSLLVRQLSADTHLSQTRCGGGQSLLPEHPLLLAPQTVR